MVNESGQGRGNAGGRPAAGGRKPQASSKGSSKSAAAGWIASRRAKASKRSMPVRILRGALIGFASLFLLAVLAFVVLYMAIDIPKANAQATQSVSVVYYADGKTEMGRFTTTNRDPVAIEKVPEHVQRAFIAAEDRSFYSNRGISPKGIARAFINNFKGEGSGSQGGSTLTQQYVKNYFLTQDKTITRKVKEVVISLKVDQEMSKNQILEAYLNNVYFGRGAYGVQAAAKSYFHKDVSKLTPVEGAFLASVVNNPENMDPTVGPNSEKRANARMAYTLNGMVSMGWLSEAERSKATMPTFYEREPVKYADGPEGYVVASVRQELSRKLKLSTTDIDRGGLRITTTIDKRTQDAAVRAVEAHTPVVLQGKLHTGLVAEKANNGAVVAMYGGADYDPVKAPYSDADRSMLQSASTMKIYAAIAALRDGKTIDTRYNGNNYMRLGPNSFVQNDHNKSYGFQPITNMLAYSINTAFVRLNQDIGPEKTLKAAQDSGMPKTLGGMNDTKEILNVLGTGDSRVVDQATGYNTLNSGGKRYDRYLISKVRTYDESYSYDVKVEGEQAYDKGIADDVTWALGKTGVYGTAAGTQYQLNRPLAAKTGTATGHLRLRGVHRRQHLVQRLHAGPAHHVRRYVLQRGRTYGEAHAEPARNPAGRRVRCRPSAQGVGRLHEGRARGPGGHEAAGALVLQPGQAADPGSSAEQHLRAPVNGTDALPGAQHVLDVVALAGDERLPGVVLEQLEQAAQFVEFVPEQFLEYVESQAVDAAANVEFSAEPDADTEWFPHLGSVT